MAECLTPFMLKKQQIQVPCGKCPNCSARRASGWSFRLMQESKVAISSHFITLTYDTTNVPISNNGFMELQKSDLQKFFKRLRKAHEKLQSQSIRYYAVGEYGGTTRRPHYHIILFNAITKLIQPAWNKGEVHYGQLTIASVGYTLKYISKPQPKKLFVRDDRQPQFSLMSKGLGLNYLSPSMIKWHKADINNRMYINYEENKKAAMPRYYKNKIYEEHERILAGKFQLDKMLEQQNLIIKKIGNDEYEKRKRNNAIRKHYERSAKQAMDSATAKL